RRGERDDGGEQQGTAQVAGGHRSGMARQLAAWLLASGRMRNRKSSSGRSEESPQPWQFQRFLSECLPWPVTSTYEPPTVMNRISRFLGRSGSVKAARVAVLMGWCPLGSC